VGNTGPLFAILHQKNMSKQSKNWVFTLNNYTEEDIKDIETWIAKGVEGVGYGKEVGANGTPHLQGFIVMQDKATMHKVKKLNQRMHLERMKGRITQSIAYCSKQAELVTVGKCFFNRGDLGARYCESAPTRTSRPPFGGTPLRGGPTGMCFRGTSRL